MGVEYLYLRERWKKWLYLKKGKWLSIDIPWRVHGMKEGIFTYTNLI